MDDYIIALNMRQSNKNNVELSFNAKNKDYMLDEIPTVIDIHQQIHFVYFIFSDPNNIILKYGGRFRATCFCCNTWMTQLDDRYFSGCLKSCQLILYLANFCGKWFIINMWKMILNLITSLSCLLCLCNVWLVSSSYYYNTSPPIFRYS